MNLLQRESISSLKPTKVPTMKNDENIFADDDALDYIMYEEVNKQGQDNQNKPGKAGCLGVLALFALPATVIGYIILNIV